MQDMTCGVPLISVPGLPGSGSLLPLSAVLLIILGLSCTKTTTRGSLHRVGLCGLLHLKLLFYLIRKATNCTIKHLEEMYC